MTVDPTRERIERELVRRYLMDRIARQELQASPAEAVVLSDWFCCAERRRVEEEKRQLCTLLDGIDESAGTLSLDGRFLYVNRHAKQALNAALGLGAGDIIGKTPSQLQTSDEFGICRTPEAMLEHARAHASFEVVSWGRAKEHRFDAVYGPDGTVTAVALVVRDIHDRKLAQTRLDLLSKLSTLVGRLDYNGLVEALAYVPIPELADWCAVNLIEDRKIRRTFVAQRDPARGPLRNALMRAAPNWSRHPLWQEMLTGGFQLLSEVSDDLLRTIASTDEQYRLLSQVGIRSMMVVPLVSRGQIAGIITLVYTTESGRRYGYDHPALAEEFALHAAHTVENARLVNELKASEARFHVALAGARTIVYEQDQSLRYVSYYNPMVKFSLVGKTHEDAFPPDDAAALTEMKRRVIERGDSIYQEMDLTIGNDERRHYREAVEPRRDASGQIVGVIGAATDLTEQQRTQQQLTEAIGFRERMMGILGHDLRSPLSTVTMASATLLRRSELPADVRDPMLRIRRAADRMTEMIDTLLDFTRAWFLGTVPIAPVPIDLSDVARGLIDELRVAWPDHPIEIDVGGDCVGQWDPARISQMISNLVGNAVAYGDPYSTGGFLRSRERVRRDAEGPQPRSGHPARSASRAVRAVSPGCAPLTVPRAASVWGSTSCSRSCVRTAAPSTSSRRPKRAPRSPFTYRAIRLLRGSPPKWARTSSSRKAGVGSAPPVSHASDHG